MILAVDIGNTNCTVALCEKDQVCHTMRLATSPLRTSDETGFMLWQFLNFHQYSAIDDVIISSVVPDVTSTFTEASKKYLHKEPLFVTTKTNTGITIAIPDPDCVGPDRLVDAAAAYAIYGGNILVIDFGTAVTYDYIDEKGNFLYGITAPGLEISARALTQMAAMLPAVPLEKPKSILATDTVTSMQAGIMYGFIGSVKEIIGTVKKEIGKDMKVIATGGYAEKINIPEINIYDRDLTFKGLDMIAKRIKKGL